MSIASKYRKEKRIIKEEQDRQSEMDNYKIFLIIMLQYKYQYQLYHKKSGVGDYSSKKDMKSLKRIQGKNNKKSHDNQKMFICVLCICVMLYF